MGRRTLKRLIILLAVLCAISAIAVYLSYDILLISTGLPTGQGPAGPKVAPQPFAHTWGENQVVLLGVGDSVTWGLGASEGRTYFDLLQKNDDSLYPDMAGKDLAHVLSNMKVVNVARNYTTTEDHLNRQLPSIPTFDPNVFGIILITSGGNDIIHDYGRTPPRDGAMYGCTIAQAEPWCNNLEDRLRQLLTGVKGKFPGGCVILLANVYDPTDGRGLPRIGGLERGFGFEPWRDANKVLDLVNGKIGKVAATTSGVHIVDVHSVMLGHGIYCKNRFARNYCQKDPTFWYYSNLEDPNPRGYDAIRRAFLLRIAELVPQELSKRVPEKLAL
jgi:lysophospholipase L1-like esterase